ncbi:cytochrome P450 [Nonomuraea rhodomycinica]|uniref:cytochrome P450 n=1 Tax=Nonomuraea rhodomycinica TaxID=1712872 RepID=UPI001C375E85|nr:cytochrome P450 [Nonomuraea rhodomycinica]
MSLAFLLLTAGHETTANMISLGVVGLLSHPEQLALVKADPSRTPMAVEELLRYFTIADGVTSRVATEDVEVGEASIKAGEGVIVSMLSANWEPAAFRDPGELDVERGARHHVAFGFGPHQCLGRCSAASPPCGSPYRPRTCRSRPTPSSTAFTNSRSPGERLLTRRRSRRKHKRPQERT